MIPLWRPLLVGLAALAVAWPFERRRPLLPPASFVRAPLLILAVLVLAYVGVTAPLLLVAFFAAWLVASTRAPGAAAMLDPRASWRRMDVAVAAGIFVVVALALRPDTPCFWDAFVWLAKARFASRGPLALVQGGLTRGVLAFIPEGYPLFDPFAVGALGGLASSPRAVVAGAVGLELLAIACFVGALADLPATSRRASATRIVAVTVLLVTCPLVVVHLRSLYVDLPLGFLLASLALLFAREGTTGACVVLAMVLASLKDEGLAHALVVAAVAAVRSLALLRVGERVEARRLQVRAAAVAIAALAVADAWHVRLEAAHLANVDHAISLPHLDRVATLVALAVGHLSDFTSWGALWALALGAALATAISPRGPTAARWLTTLVVGDALVVLAGLLVTPDRVMSFATGGTLLNRIAMQLTPLAALLVAAWLPEWKVAVNPRPV